MNYIEKIQKYIPINEQEEVDKKNILKCIELFDDVLSRENTIVHLTSSAFVLNQERNKTLMVHHNIYNSWSWTGGHADGESDLLKVAINELKEETGVKSIRNISDEIQTLDVLNVKGHMKNGKYVGAHLHLSVGYLLEVSEEEETKIKIDENSGVKWIELDELDWYTKNEPHMQLIYKKLINKAKRYK